LASVLLVGRLAEAQQTLSGIAGAVKDPAGTPVAAVTVEAASPALIEKVRTVVTDGQGQFKFTDLPPGTYSVTFKAGGFSTMKQDGSNRPPVSPRPEYHSETGNPNEVVTVTVA
jgi:hypothetical protein